MCTISANLGSIFGKYFVFFSYFADDVQIDLPLKTNYQASIPVLLDCLRDIQSWMEVNLLNLNKNKT